MYNHVNKMTIGYGNEEWGRLPAGGVPPPPPPSFPNPAALYRLDGDGLDASGNGLNLGGTGTYGPGKFGDALTDGTLFLFDGYGLSGSLAGSWSLSGWFDAVGEPGAVILQDADENAAINISAVDGVIGFTIDEAGENLADSFPVTAGWHHFAIVSASGEVSCYLDGAEVYSGSLSGTLTTFGLTLSLGSSDDVALVSSALTAEQVAYLAAGNQYPV